jgi:hypothetical protein
MGCGWIGCGSLPVVAVRVGVLDIRVISSDIESRAPDPGRQRDRDQPRPATVARCQSEIRRIVRPYLFINAFARASDP